LVIFSTAVALTIALALTRYIARPISELDAAIRQLGSADFAHAITVRGPEDLQTLGERLDWLRRRLAELEAEKNGFLRHLWHELALQAKGQRLVLDLEKMTVEADPEKLRSIIDNLLGNAVKFTPAGGTISVAAHAEDDGAGAVLIDVIDSGPGVPLEERESIF